MIHLAVFLCGCGFCMFVYFIADLITKRHSEERASKLEKENSYLIGRIVRQRKSLALLNKKYTDLLKSKKDD